MSPLISSAAIATALIGSLNSSIWLYTSLIKPEVASGEKITALADASNELMDITAEVLLRELCKEELYYAFIIMRGKLSGEAEWSMTRDGNHAFEITAMPAYCDAEKKLVEVIIVKGEDLLAA